MHRPFRPCLMLLLLVAPFAVAVEPDDPLWAEDLAPDSNASEIAITGRSKVIKDPYGYVCQIRVGGSWDDTAKLYTGGRLVRMRYIPNKGGIDMPAGVPTGGIFHSGLTAGDDWASYWEGPTLPGYDSPQAGLNTTPGRLSSIPAKGFWMSETEVEQATWEALVTTVEHPLEPYLDPTQVPPVIPATGHDGPQFTGEARPIERLTYSAAETWASGLEAWLTKIAKTATDPEPADPAATTIDPITVRLPTEQEWEYACRAGGETTFTTGATIAPIQWNVELLPGSSDHHNGRYAGAGYTSINDIMVKDWTTPIADYVSLGNSHWNIWSKEKIETGRYYVNGCKFTLKVTITPKDYFLINTGGSSEANIDSRQRNHYIPSHFGDFASVVRRYRKLAADHYIADPFVPDAQCYYRRLDIDADPAVSLTPDLAFVPASATFAYDSPRPGREYGEPWFDSPDGDHYSTSGSSPDPANVVPLEIGAYVRIADRYTASSATPDRFNTTHFTPAEHGEWIKLSHGSRVRFHRIAGRYNRGVYDYGGYYFGRTVPGVPIDPFDRGKVEGMIQSLAMPAKLIVNGGDPNNLTFDSSQTSTIAEDVAALRSALRSFYAPQSFIKNGDVYEFRPWTSWGIDVNVTVDWSQIDTLRSGDGFGSYAGFDVDEMTLGSFKPNPWGLYHMHGNVAEWCSSSWDGLSAYDNHADDLLYRIVRGGSWRRGASYARSAARERRLAEAITPNIDGGNAQVATFSKPGYDDVGFRFVIPVAP